MSFLSFFWPQILETVESPISGEVKVIEQFGKRRLEIGGMIQSGGIVERIWNKALSRCPAVCLSSCLILGLGAGTAIKILNESCRAVCLSSCKLIGVEIDPEIVRLGKKYFGLGEMGETRNLRIVISNAIDFINQQLNNRTIEQWTLILVDLYQGREIPKNCQTTKFLESLKKIKSKNGLIVFNRLYSRDEKRATGEFVKKCRQVFGSVKTSKAICNLIVLCR